jgi:hypothetical protein
MSFSVEITPGKDSCRHGSHRRHQTVMTFVSKYDAESFAQLEHAGLMQNENIASQRFVKSPTAFLAKEGLPRRRRSTALVCRQGDFRF